MTGKQLREDHFENLIQDTHDITHTYALLSSAKNKIERLYKLAILINTDTSKTAAVGDGYLTMKALPTDFREMIKLYVGTMPYWPVPYASRISFRDAARRYYIDHKNAQFALCGTIGSVATISQIYRIKTTDLTEANEDTDNIITWPEEFQPLVAYEAAKIFLQNIDPDTTAVAQGNYNAAEHQALLDSFIAWDHDIKLAAMNNQGGYADDVLDGEGSIDLAHM